MRSPTIRIQAAAIAVLALAGCAGQDGEASSGEDAVELATLSVYAAASLEAAFTDVIAHFETANEGVTVDPVYDGSSTLVTQIVEGAPADVFASADEPNMADLVDAGLAEGDPEPFATNTLVIAVAPGNPLGIADLDDLAGLDYAVCAPDVPCGNATKQLFDNAGVTLAAVSEEQNVTAVAERVAGGEVDAGLVYATDVVTREDELDAVDPSGASDVVNVYPITTVTSASEAGELFVEYVLSEDGQETLAQYGFGSP